jgi:O-antigen ligase
VAFATGVVALALAAAPALRERRLLLRASTAVVGGAVLVAVYGFVARLAFGNKLYGVWSVPTVAPFGPFVSKNHFAGYVELAALLAVGLASGLTDEARRGPGWLSWIESRRAKWIVTAWGAVFVLVLAVPVSLSRGGVVSLYIGVLMFGVLRLWTRGSPRLSARGLAIGFAGVVLAVAPVAALLPVEARGRVITLTRVTTDQSGSFRIAVWRDSLRLIASSPWVGSGFGAYEDALPRFKAVAGDHRVQRAESDYVEFLADGGAVGGVLLASLASVLLLSGVWVPVSAGTGRLQRGVRTGGLAGIVAMGVHSIFDFNLHIPSNALLCVLLAALALHASTGARPNSMPSGAGWRRMLPMAAVLAVTAVVALRTPWSEVRVDPTLLNRAAAGRPAGLRWTSLREEVAAHLHRRPTDSSAWVILAWVRAPSSRREAAALATWAVQLDPRHEALRRAAARHY